VVRVRHVDAVHEGRRPERINDDEQQSAPRMNCDTPPEDAQHENQQQRPDQIELLFNRKRPVMQNRIVVVGGPQIVDRSTRLLNVVEE
jgi:hypothetical protein